MKKLTMLFVSFLSIQVFALLPMTVSAEETVVVQGTWTKKTQKASGNWQIVETEEGQTVIKFDDAFKTKKAPDLKVFLSPKNGNEANNKNAQEGALFIGDLSSPKGAQSYEVPEGVNVSEYQSILIHCEAYTKLWSAGSF